MPPETPSQNQTFNWEDLAHPQDDQRPGWGMAIFAVIACVGYLSLAALLPSILGMR